MSLPESMLQPATFNDEPDERPLQAVRLVPVDESEDDWGGSR